MRPETARGKREKSKRLPRLSIVHGKETAPGRIKILQMANFFSKQ